MKHEISKMFRRLRTETPPEKRTARAMLALVEATRRARAQTVRAVMNAELGTGVEAAVKKRLVRELTALRTRLDAYAAALAKAKPNGPIPKTVRPLFYQVPGAGHFTPDALTPFTINNQLREAERFYASQEGQFWRYYVEELKKLPAKAVKAARELAQDIADEAMGAKLFPWIAGVGAIVLGGVTVWAITRKMERAA